MERQGLFRSRQFVLAASLMVVFILTIIFVTFFTRMIPEAYTRISDSATAGCALIAAMLFTRVWYTTSEKDVSKKIWGLAATAMVFWLIAESTWGFYEVILGQEIPYPSVADFFWLFGYIFFYAAMVIQYRLFKTTLSQQQKLIITLLSIVFILLVGLLVLKPVIESFDPTLVVESLLNIAYPLADLILLILTFVIIFAVEQGRFSFTWRLFGLGLIFMALGDIIFGYTSTLGIYSPGVDLNAITLLVDLLYYAAYLTLGLGAFTYWLISESQQAIKINLVLLAQPKTNILVFVDRLGGHPVSQR